MAEGFFTEFLVSAAIGGLIGVEREHRDDGLPVIAGVRTFPLISIAGFLLAEMATEVGVRAGDGSGAAFVLAAGLLGIFGLSFMFIHLRISLGQSGITTPVTMIVTFLLGLAIGHGYIFESVVVAVVVTALLVTKKRLHRFASMLDDDEVLSALQFITLMFILLPITSDWEGPDMAGFGWLGRGELVDPYVILLVSVFVAAISFASLIAMRQIGPHRGLQFSGLMGGLVNSEATTASLAQRAKEDRALIGAAVAGSLLASTTMLGRNLAIAAAADTTFAFAWRMAPFVLLVGIVGAVLSYRAARGEKGEAIGVRVKNPFAVLPALRFAVFFALVSLLVSVATERLGEGGVYIAALGGFVSAGAVVASLGSLVATGGIPLELAVRTGLLAMAASVAGKLVILRYTDMETFRRALPAYAVMSGVALLAAGAAFVIG